MNLIWKKLNFSFNLKKVNYCDKISKLAAIKKHSILGKNSGILHKTLTSTAKNNSFNNTHNGNKWNNELVL